MLSAAIVVELHQLERGIKMYHAGLTQNVLLLAPVLLVMCDNSQASGTVPSRERCKQFLPCVPGISILQIPKTLGIMCRCI